MLHSLLNSDPTKFVSFGEASLYALIGFCVVFIGIAFLIGVVWAVGKLMSKIDGKLLFAPKKAKAVEAKTEEQQVQAATNNSEEVSEETVAIITAALMAYYEKNNLKCEFTVKRIKRI